MALEAPAVGRMASFETLMMIAQMESLQAVPDEQTSAGALHDRSTGPQLTRMVSLRTEEASVTAESEEARPRCFECGTRTDYPMRAGGDCPHVACSVRCLEKVHSTWLDMKAEFHEMDRSLGCGDSADTARLDG